MDTPTADGNLYRSPYTSTMAKRILLGMQEFRLKLAERLLASRDDTTNHIPGEHTVVTRHGKPDAVLVPITWYREACAKLNDPTEF